MLYNAENRALAAFVCVLLVIDDVDCMVRSKASEH